MIYDDKEGREAMSTLKKNGEHSWKLHSNRLSIPFWKVSLCSLTSAVNTHWEELIIEKHSKNICVRFRRVERQVNDLVHIIREIWVWEQRCGWEKGGHLKAKKEKKWYASFALHLYSAKWLKRNCVILCFSHCSVFRISLVFPVSKGNYLFDSYCLWA